MTGETFAEMKGSEEAERIAELERRIKLAVIGTFLISFHSFARDNGRSHNDFFVFESIERRRISEGGCRC